MHLNVKRPPNNCGFITIITIITITIKAIPRTARAFLAVKNPFEIELPLASCRENNCPLLCNMKRLGNKNGQVFFHARGLFPTPQEAVLKILNGCFAVVYYEVGIRIHLKIELLQQHPFN